MNEKPRRGFASMDQERQRQIASKGGKAAHVKGRAHGLRPSKPEKRGVKVAKRSAKTAVTWHASVAKEEKRSAATAFTWQRIGRKGGAAVSESPAHGRDWSRRRPVGERRPRSHGRDWSRRGAPAAEPPV